MSIGDSYIAIGIGLIETEDFKEAWTGSIGDPTLLTTLECSLEGSTSIESRMNEFAAGRFALISDPIDFYINRAARLTEDSYTVLGVTQAEYVGR
jgi:hypothetical protein